MPHYREDKYLDLLNRQEEIRTNIKHYNRELDRIDSLLDDLQEYKLDRVYIARCREEV